MSSFYDDASLVVIPSGYKTSKVYAEKPTDGSGDLAFTRTGDTATRVNSAGLIERVRTNLLLQSNTFSNAAWTKSNATVTSGQTGYDGTSNAWLLSKSGAYGRVEQSLATTGLETFSVYVKAGNSNYTEITSNAGPYVAVNLTNGSIVAQSGVTALITSVGSGWYRISISYTKAASNLWRIIAGDTGSTSSAAGSAGTIVIQAAQAEAGDIATAYIPTTSAAVSVGPVANVPRLDYLGSTCPRLLLEPQRTNSQRASEQLSSALYWSTGGGTISANLAVSPDGYQNADKFVESATTARHELYSDSLAFSGTSSVSIFAKASGRRYFSAIVGGNPSQGGATFDLQTGTITATSGGTAATITPFGNDWYRCTFTTTASGTSQVYFCLRTTGGTPTVETYAGDGTSGIIFWGCQVELAAPYPTSYIPTLAASATRGADACSKTGISSLIGQTEGTLFVEFNILNLNPANVSRIILSDGTTNNYLFLGINESGSGNLSRLFINNTASSFSLSLFSSNAITVGRHKLALAYKSGSFALYLDGNSVASSATSGTIPATSQLVIGGVTPSSVSNLETFTLLQTLLFTTRLTNAQLAELTTL